jgi:leucyl-tRNA synthetase
MLAIYTDLRNQTRAFRRVTSHDRQRMEKAKNYHEKIYNGLMSLNLEMTISAVTTHVEFSRVDALSDYASES